LSWAPMTNACNPSYSGHRNQEDCSLKPAQANSSRNTILKIPNIKNKAGGMAQGVECLPPKHKALRPNYYH
jgi:hypothetical protein